MLPVLKSVKALLVIAFILPACSKKVQQKEDEIYSRHLQQRFLLTVISTPVPDDKGQMNLLILNDGQDAAQLKIKEALSNLYTQKQINPLVIVAVHAVNRNDIYGVTGYPSYQKLGTKADKYAEFIDDELYPYIKKKSGVRKFKTVAIAGASLGGLSAFDIAWNHADKIDKVGVFSGSFWWRDKDQSDPDYNDDKNRIIINMVRASRKKPHLKYWFYAGDKEETSDRDKDGITDVVDDTRDLAALIQTKNVCAPGDIYFSQSTEGRHDYESWSKAFPAFLIWAFGNTSP